MASRFWVGGSGNLDGVSTTHISASSGGAGGASYPGAADIMTFDGSSGGGTVTATADNTWSGMTWGAFTGTLDWSANNNNMTISGNSGFSGQGSATRTFNMGNGTWNMTGSAGGNTWRIDNATNLTFNANGSTLLFSNNGLSYAGMLSAALTYNKIEIAGSVQFFTQALTIGTLKLDATSYLALSNFVTYTISTALIISGASSAAQVGLVSNSQGAPATLVLPASTTAQWVSLRDIDFLGSGSTPVFSNSFNLGDVLHGTVTGPGAGSGISASRKLSGM